MPSLFPVAASRPAPSAAKAAAAAAAANSSCHGAQAALTASYSADSSIDETDPFALIQRGLNQQAHNDMWGAADSFGRASVMLKRRSDDLLAKEAAQGIAGKVDSTGQRRSKYAKSHNRTDSQNSLTSSGSGTSGPSANSGTFNLEGERRSVRREAAEVFKERSREYFRQARESLIAAMAIDTKASSSSESKDSTLDEQGVRDRCVIFKRLFAPGHTQGGVPADSSPIAVTSYSQSKSPNSWTMVDSETATGTNGNGGKDDALMRIEHEEDLRALSRRFEELEEMAVSPHDYAIVGGDGDFQHSYETSNLIDSNLEPHYSNLIDSANAPIFGVDRQGRVNVWNQCASRLVGYTPSEVMGHELVKGEIYFMLIELTCHACEPKPNLISTSFPSFIVYSPLHSAEFITRDYQASVQAVLDRALRGDETANFEFPLMTKAGARIEVLLNATARRNPGGKIIGVVGIGQDITGRIAQEREYSKLIDTANAPIFGVDIDGKVNVWNQCAMRLVGYTAEEVMGYSLVQEFITDDFKVPVQTVLDQALRGEETANFEFPLITKGGARIEILLNATTRRDEQGNMIGVVGIGQDITARLAQEREYSKLIDTANAPIFGVDIDGRVNVWNQCAQRLVGYSMNEVMGKNLVQVCAFAAARSSFWPCYVHFCWN